MNKIWWITKKEVEKKEWVLSKINLKREVEQ